MAAVTVFYCVADMKKDFQPLFQELVIASLPIVKL